MKINSLFSLSNITFVITIIALIISCVDNPEDPEEVIDFSTIKLDTFNITALFSVNQSSIQRDSVLYTKINWDAVSNAQSYRIFVYDTADTTVPDHIINSNDNSCTINKYEINHSYWVEAFALRKALLVDWMDNDTAPGDTNYDYTEMDMGFVHFIFADSSYTDYKIDSLDSIGFPQIDTSFISIYGYYLMSNNTDTFNIELDTTFLYNAFRFVPDGYEKFYKSFSFNAFNSPDSIWINHIGNSLTVLWNCIPGEYISEYRAYLRDFNGIVKNSIDTLCTHLDTIKDMIADTIIEIITIGDSVQSVSFASIINNSVYKINVAAISALGVGPLDSIYTIFDTNAAHTSFKMPYKYYSTYHTLSDTLNMVGIQGGIFIIGQTWDEDPSFCPGAVPFHEVVIPSFYLGKFEVTYDEYVIFLNDIDTFTIDSVTGIIEFKNDSIADTSSDTWFISFANDSFTVDSGKGNYPVLSLYWYGAAAYCNWLSNSNGLDSCYDSSWNCSIYKNGYRLPTEAEFEYVASGAFNGIKSRFPWGIEWSVDSAAVGGDVKPVGSYTPYNGFYDLTGNAMEYVNDFSDYLTGANLESSSYYIECSQQGVVINPTGSNSVNKHMLRGGSYVSNEEESVVYSRFIHPPDSRISEYGFRVARNANGKL